MVPWGVPKKHFFNKQKNYNTPRISLGVGPFGSLQTYHQADAWRVVIIFFLKKHVFVEHPIVPAPCTSWAILLRA